MLRRNELSLALNPQLEKIKNKELEIIAKNQLLKKKLEK